MELKTRTQGKKRVKTIKTVCHRDCPDTCFIDVDVENNKIQKTTGSKDHPVTRGFLCPRGKKDKERVYSKDRILYPYVKNAEGQFERATWEDALSTVSDQLKQTLEIFGNESILLYDYAGNQGLLSWQFARRLWLAIGATTTDYALCSNSGHDGIGLHYGLAYGLQPEDLRQYKSVVFWGNNAKVSAPHQWALAADARKKHGTVIISVDPRKSPTSLSSDMSIQPAPGTDVALCYGIARHLILNSGVDQGFVDKWATGFKAYHDAALKWTPGRVTALTGIESDCIEKVGDLLMERQPAAFMVGLGLQKSADGAQAARAVSLLPALLGQHRGFRYSDSRARYIDWGYLNGERLTGKKGPVVSQVSIGEKLQDGAFKFMFTLGSNPAVTLPDTIAVRNGLERDDLYLVVMDTHWTKTAQLADMVLPAPTFYEKQDLAFCDNHRHCRLSHKAIDPLGESRNERWVMRNLAEKMELTDSWLFENTRQALGVTLKAAFEEGGVKELEKGAVLKLKTRIEIEYQTPSGRIEFYSTSAEEKGLDPLPVQSEIEKRDNELVLLNSSIAQYTHSQFTDVYGPVPGIVWINPEDAAHRGVADGDIVELSNTLAAITLKAELTDNMVSGSLWCPRPVTGLNGTPLNALVSGTAQEIGGGPVFNSTRVILKKTVS